jgi:RNA methyltransferase, TrmH family
MFVSYEPISRSLQQHIRSLQKSAYREEHQEFVVEGITGIRDMMARGFTPTCIVADGELPFDASTDVYLSSKKHLDIMSALVESPGTLAVFPFVTEHPLGNRIVILDGVSDPGNVGTLIRSCLWFGATDVCLWGSCADLYNPKVVRAAMGSFGALNIVRRAASALVLPDELAVVGLVARGGAPADVLQGANAYVLVIGSEAHGISLHWQQRCTTLVTIGGDAAESLNAAVAGSIALYECSKVRQ